ncbi:N-acetylglucosamine-1-phosphotransferase subunit gamma-like [Gigantopelta aegis]|uniref:N-acetylglucosamine-1-phosphotransferase subunit gamma-like n=1 Tax=Gigantopelta aegis TaxID=1735272 RepID=UPI001B88D72D|nr:N-acetylglucosamine-1-phosphotransferase subunit gamma-like [Gigantopelta aegis]
MDALTSIKTNKILFYDNVILSMAAFLLLSMSPNRVLSSMVEMKIVDEPSTYGYAGMGSFYQPQDQSLKLRVKPANFSGPPHLKRLFGKCFTKTDETYKYKFCPFYNVSQHEQGLRWNPYNGVLGVWQEWEISNNTFTAMLLREGDSCGEKFRSVRVVFVCGNKSEVTNVTESRTCEYELTFRTQLVCHRFAMLVYPVLTADLQDRWNELEGQLDRKEITQKGYKKRLNKVFEDAGLQLSADVRQHLLHEANEKAIQEEKQAKGDLETLDQCKQELTNLRTEMAGLRTLLELHGITDSQNGIEKTSKDGNSTVKTNLNESNNAETVNSTRSTQLNTGRLQSD